MKERDKPGPPLDSSVRMIANGDETVNALRAERSPAYRGPGEPCT